MEVVMAASRLATISACYFAARRFLSGAAFIAALLAAALGPARAQQPQAVPAARIVVVGQGSVSVAPDYAEIRSGVTTRAKTAKEATDANSKLMAAIVAALRDAGVEPKDIQTAQFSVHPIYAPAQPNSEAKLSGFSASNQVSVTVRQIAKAGDILDRLIAAGATDVGNVELLHSDLAKPLDQARQAAVADARRKAELYAQAAGVTLGRVAWITEDSGNTPMPLTARSMVAKAAPVPIAAGEDTLQVVITVGFDFAP
jgi:uncharacterized protein